jgi:hypothetical protein
MSRIDVEEYPRSLNRPTVAVKMTSRDDGLTAPC